MPNSLHNMQRAVKPVIARDAFAPKRATMHHVQMMLPKLRCLKGLSQRAPGDLIGMDSSN